VTAPRPDPAELVTRLQDDIRVDAARLHAAELRETPSYTPTTALPLDHPQRDRYRLDELVHVHGEEFVERAYVCLLKRRPDAAALLQTIDRLYRGDSKIAVLGDLRWSAEGRRQGMRVDSLRLRYVFWRITQWPVIGAVVERVALIAALPSIAREQRRLGQLLHDTESASAELTALRAEIAELRRHNERSGPA
jgi:hypothetical protein